MENDRTSNNTYFKIAIFENQKHYVIPIVKGRVQPNNKWFFLSIPYRFNSCLKVFETNIKREIN